MTKSEIKKAVKQGLKAAGVKGVGYVSIDEHYEDFPDTHMMIVGLQFRYKKTVKKKGGKK